MLTNRQTRKDDFTQNKIIVVAAIFEDYFVIVKFLFLDGDAPRRPLFGVYISQLISLLEYVVMLTLILTINA